MVLLNSPFGCRLESPSYEITFQIFGGQKLVDSSNLLEYLEGKDSVNHN